MAIAYRCDQCGEVFRDASNFCPECNSEINADMRMKVGKK